MTLCKNCGHGIRKVRIGSQGGSVYNYKGYTHWGGLRARRNFARTGVVCFYCECNKPEPNILKVEE